MTNWTLNEIDDQLINLALREDLGLVFEDKTTKCLLGETSERAMARIISKEDKPIVLCGLFLLDSLFQRFQQDFILTSNYDDGSIVPANETILSIEADSNTLLMVERTLLNFFRHLSGIATTTRAFVDQVKHTQLKILDTRKTMPGFRHLEKYAVHCGGGFNHRMGLYDAVMVKDTHIDALGGMTQALAKLPKQVDCHGPVIVEVRNIRELNIVIEQGKEKVTRVLLDNMTPAQLTECVALCQDIFPCEASGNLNLGNILAVAETGVNYASVGAITHSAGNLDLSMKWHEVKDV